VTLSKDRADMIYEAQFWGMQCVLVGCPKLIVSALSSQQTQQDAQLSQRDRTAGCVSFGQKWKTGTGRQYFTDILGLSSTTVT